MKVFYYELEPIPERYTEQLSNDWMPAFFDTASIDYVRVEAHSRPEAIKTGSVLDATRRGRVSLMQNTAMLNAIAEGEVTDEDVIYLQDFWTPGFESVLYSLHLHGIKPRIYSTLWAQSVDEYDFTFPMRHWMRPMELGLANSMSGIFVASTILRDQLRQAGFDCPIHVVGLPYYTNAVSNRMSEIKNGRVRENTVIYSSRLDPEKNPTFMCKVASRFLMERPDWSWEVVSGSDIQRNAPDDVKGRLGATANTHPGKFLVRGNLTKDRYYDALVTAKIQFNSSLQDYVSFTLLEALTAGCRPAYPAHRSFPECLPYEYLYRPGDVSKAVDLLHRLADQERMPTHRRLRLPDAQVTSTAGGFLTAQIIAHGTKRERNVWLEGT